MQETSPEFQFERSPERPGLSPIAQATLHLGEIAEKIALENRTHVDHANGRPENVAEHSNMLAIVAPALAEEFFPELNPLLVAWFCPPHDIVEAYVKDTPTHDITPEGQRQKDAREHRGAIQLYADYAHIPSFVRRVKEYEAQEIPEARFVRMVDKCMPQLMHFANGGDTLRTYIDAEGVRENSRQRSAVWRQEYPEFEAIIALREELVELMVQEFLTDQPS